MSSASNNIKSILFEVLAKIEISGKIIEPVIFFISVFLCGVL